MFEHLNNIEGVSIYPIISLAIFFVFFIVLIIWALRTDKNYLIKMGNLPLESSSPDNSSIGEKNEN